MRLASADQAEEIKHADMQREPAPASREDKRPGAVPALTRTSPKS